MNSATFETLIPGFGELRAREKLNRAIIFSGITRRVCGVDVRPLTPEFKLLLQMHQNAFVNGVAAQLGDVFAVLWILNPNRIAHPGFFGRRANDVRQFFLRRHVRKLELEQATREVRLFLLEQLQDLPDMDDEGGRDQSTWVHWIAADASFWLHAHGGFTLSEYMRTPCLVLQQLYRSYQLQHPKIERDSQGNPYVVEPSFRNSSDRMIDDFHAQHRRAIAEMITANRYRAA